MKKLWAILLICFSLPVYSADIEGTAVLLRGVDKITGRTNTGTVPVGKPTTLRNLRITPLRCLKKPPEETPEDAAFLLIEEETKDHNFNVIFNGWMFSSDPALSAMEHPIFDIWVLECITDNSTKKFQENPKLNNSLKPLKNEVSVNELEEI